MNSLVYSAIMYKARTMMTAPLRAYKGDPDYPTRLSPKHSLSKLVARPNEHQSGTEFHALNVVYLNVAGNVYIYKDRKHRELQALRPDRVFIVPTGNTVPAKLSHYLYVPEGKSPHQDSSAETFPILPEDMIHIKLPNPLDPLEGMGYGMSPMSACARDITIDNMVTDFLNTFFQKGTMLTGILTFDIPLKEDVVDTILERWEKKYGGHSKWSTGVLDRGGTYQRLGLTFEEMGFAEQDARNECRILGPFGVPPILISSRVGLERSTYSNYESAREACWQDTLVPELKMFEVEYQRHLRAREAFVKFDLSQVPALQKDLAPIVNSAFTLWQMGVPANQALAAVGLRIGDVPGGDVPHISSSARGEGQGPHVGDDEGWGQVP
jgi:HK97 family phage portal protein